MENSKQCTVCFLISVFQSVLICCVMSRVLFYFLFSCKKRTLEECVSSIFRNVLFIYCNIFLYHHSLCSLSIDEYMVPSPHFTLSQNLLNSFCKLLKSNSYTGSLSHHVTSGSLPSLCFSSISSITYEAL